MHLGRKFIWGSVQRKNNFNAVSTQTTPSLLKSHTSPDLLPSDGEKSNLHRQKSVEINRINKKLIRQDPLFKSIDDFTINQKSYTSSQNSVRQNSLEDAAQNSSARLQTDHRNTEKSSHTGHTGHIGQTGHIPIANDASYAIEYDQASDIRIKSATNNNNRIRSASIGPVDSDSIIIDSNMIENSEQFSSTDRVSLKVLYSSVILIY